MLLGLAVSAVWLCGDAGAAEYLPNRGDTLSVFRAQLLRHGWKPLATRKKDSEALFGDGRILYDAGFHEVEMCSGTGRNYCIFNYSRKGGCLQVVTVGEYKAGAYEPIFDNLMHECPSKTD